MRLPDFPIPTARLLLRPFTTDDLDDVYEYMADAEVVRYLYWEVRDRAGVAEALAGKVGSGLEGDGSHLTLAVVLPGEGGTAGKVIGEALLKYISVANRQGEVGYVLNPAYHGHGYATEAAAAILRLGFEHVGLHRIDAHLDARNTASAQVLERLGMRREAHFVENEIFKGEWGDEFVYAILENEWQARLRSA